MIPPANPFYLVVTVNKRTDAVIAVDSYGRLSIAKGRRTRVREDGFWDAKVFEATYSLGCITALELDLT